MEYVYDDAGRLTDIRYFNATDHSSPVKTVNFTYDALGNILTYNDGTTSAVYTYDDLSRKTSEEINYGTFSLGYDYEYFANGLKKTFTGPDGETIEYSYDENNRTAGITIPGQGQITYNTYQWNSPTRVTLPGGSTTDYTYDPLMRLKTLTAKDPGQNPVVTRDYTYSPASNITAKNTEHGNYTYQYDNLYRLTEAINPTVADEEYTYDPLGNRLTSANTTGTWSYNTNNELTGYDNVSYIYDANGNTTNKTNGTSETKYIYDTEDRLTEVRDGADALIATYYYDPFGRRLWKDVDGTRTYFLYSDEGLIGEYDSTGTEIKTYGWAPGSQWSTDPLFVKTGSTYYWYRNDHQGTPQKITSTNGAVVWSAVYDSFGNCQIGTENITNNLRFAGQYFDSETGLYYNLNRYYDPTIGRYLRIDPFGQGLNLYTYCFNNPHSWIDPLGLCAYNKVSGWVHGGLAALGLIPGIGIVPDLIDAGLYLLEGNLLDAGIAGAAAIPVIGLFTRGGEYLYKFGKYLLKSEKLNDLFRSGWRIVNNNIGALGDVGSLKKGAKKRPIVIGEDMPDRVIPAADKYGADYYKPPDAPPDQWMDNNKKWINEAMDEGRGIIDKGPAPGRKNYPEPTSDYYNMERDQIRNRDYKNYIQIHND